MCGTTTDSLKAYRMPTFVLFLFIGASFRSGEVVACPSCMRKTLAKLTLKNLLPANLLWLLLLVPWYAIAALRSLTPGHSASAAIQLYRLSSPARVPPQGGTITTSPYAQLRDRT